MFKIIYLGIIVVMLVLALTGFEFHTKPLSFKLRDSYLFFGLILLVAAITLIYYAGSKTK